MLLHAFLQGVVDTAVQNVESQGRTFNAVLVYRWVLVAK